MERLSSINAGRISWCCSDLGMTTAQLAAAASVSKSSIARALSGEGMTFGQLSKIAAFFGRGVLFFLDPEPAIPDQIHTPAFRTLANQKPTLSPKLRLLIQQAESQRDIFLSLREDLELSDKDLFQPPDLKGFPLHQAAQRARAWLNLDLGASPYTFEDYRAAVEARGVLVFRSNGYNGAWQIPKDSSIQGFSLYFQKSPVIFIRKLAAEAAQSFTLMHELAHILLHQQGAIDDERDFHSSQGREQEANAFAGHLLVPDAFLSEIQDRQRPDEVSRYDAWLEKQRKAWGVSGEVILRRLLDAGRLDAEHYRAYRAWKASLHVVKDGSGSREYRHREPRHLFGDTFVKTVLDALSAQHITLPKASKYLDHLKIADLHKLESYYAGV